MPDDEFERRCGTRNDAAQYRRIVSTIDNLFAGSESDDEISPHGRAGDSDLHRRHIGYQSISAEWRSGSEERGAA